MQVVVVKSPKLLRGLLGYQEKVSYLAVHYCH